MIDFHLGFSLPMTVNSTIPLFHAIGVPGYLVVNEAGTMILQVDALGSGICSEENANRGNIGRSLKGRLNPLSLFVRHAAVKKREPALAPHRCLSKALGCEQAVKPLLRRSVFSKDDYSPVCPCTTRPDIVEQ